MRSSFRMLAFLSQLNLILFSTLESTLIKNSTFSAEIKNLLRKMALSNKITLSIEQPFPIQNRINLVRALAFLVIFATHLLFLTTNTGSSAGKRLLGNASLLYSRKKKCIIRFKLTSRSLLISYSINLQLYFNSGKKQLLKTVLPKY